MKYDDIIQSKRAEYGDKFDSSDLNPDFIPYFNNGNVPELRTG